MQQFLPFFYIKKRIAYNFRYLFQLLSGASEDLLKRLHLSRDPNQYYYVKQGNSANVDTINDKNDFKEVGSSLNTLQFTKEDQDTLWRVVGATLHLGNIEFDDEEEKLVVKKSKSFDIAAQLLQVSFRSFF